MASKDDDKSDSSDREDEVSATILAKFEKFGKLHEERTSDSAATGDLKWHIDLLGADAIPMHWKAPVRVTIKVINQKDRKKSVRGRTTKQFHFRDTEVGFSQTVRLKDLVKEGVLVNESLHVQAKVRIDKVHLARLADKTPPPSPSAAVYTNGQAARPWDSKAETGYLGLKNQGATCYLNSLLQALYHTAPFRVAVYHMPTMNDAPTKSIPFALQRVFMKLQCNDKPVGTKELTKSFGWDAWDSMAQQDAQEMSRVLMDNLEEKMKGTAVEGTISKLFQGKIANFIKCLHVPFHSTRIETFYDLSLIVKGCRDLYNSFDRYVETELLSKSNGNQYQAENHGLQDAQKGSLFVSFPPVLHVQLKRFEYDPVQETNVKVNDRFEFPVQMKLDKYLTPDADRTISNTYLLYGVLVHRGDVTGGHYYAFFRPGMKWCRFDDTRVTLVSEREAVDENFGGEEDPKRAAAGYGWKRSANAYMLVYIRDTELPSISSPVDMSAIPAHLQRKFEEYKQEKAKRKKEAEEAPLYQTIRVAAERDLRLHSSFDLVHFETVHSFRVKKNSTMKQFRERVFAGTGVAPERQRYWHWVSRQNRTYRPDVPLSPAEELKTLAELRRRDFFLEVTPLLPAPSKELTLKNGDAPPPSLFPEHKSDDTILFFKFYDYDKCRLEFVGHRVFPSNTKLSDTLPILNRWKGFPSDTPLLLFEEVRPSMVNQLKPWATLAQEEIVNGDIVIFQKLVPMAQVQRNSYWLVVQFCDYLNNKTTIQFVKLSGKKDVAINLDLSTKMTYDQVAARLAEKLDADPMKLRFTPYSGWNRGPAEASIKRNPATVLSEMITPNSPSILYYEVLDFSITELENKKQVRIAWQNSRGVLLETYTVLLDKTAKISDLISKLSAVVPLEGTKKLRIFEVVSCRVEKVYKEDASIEGINELNAKLRAEEILEEELSPQSGDRLIRCVHYSSKDEYSFGNPFVLLIRKVDTVGDVKAKVKAKLHVPDESFKVWRLLIVSPLTRQTLVLADDAYILGEHVFKTENSEMLGLDHPANINAKYNGYYYKRKEKAIKITG